MENVKLRMNYMGQSFTLMIEDTDRVLLIDLLNDMVDEAKKQGIPLPTYPILTYNYVLRPVEITDDKGLMEMFDRLKERRGFINIFIASLSAPNHAWLMARQVVANRNADMNASIGDVGMNVVTTENVLNKGKRKLPVRRATKAIPSHVTSQEVLRRSPRKPLTQSSEVEGPNPSLTVVTQSSEVHEDISSPRKTCQRAAKDHDRFKMPKTTAKKLNVYVQKTKTLPSMNGGSQMVTRRKRVEYEDPEFDDSDSEGSNIPSDEDVNDIEDEVTDLEDEDTSVLTSLNFIDDGYVPFDENKWIDDEDPFASKMYSNGEIYDDKEFGAIKLRPWMLFMEKEHFKDVTPSFIAEK